MDTIQEALRQLNMSESTIATTKVAKLCVDRARVLTDIAMVEQIERIIDNSLIKEPECPSKRIVITLNDDTDQDQIDSLTQAVGLMADQLKITAVIVYEQT